MSSAKQPCLTAICWAVVLTALLGLAPSRALAQPRTPPSAPVTVVNTPVNPVPVTAPQPLPISGTINVGGTSSVNVTNPVLPVNGTVSVTNTLDVVGSVNATQAGAWNVEITGTPTVNVDTSVSSPLIVAPIGPAVVQPFAADFGASGGDYVVPVGKQAVVELITFDNWQQDTGLYELLVSLTVNAKFIEFRLGPTFVQPYKPTNSLRYYGVHNLRLYADPGSTIHVGGNGVIGQGGVTISGHLIDHP